MTTHWIHSREGIIAIELRTNYNWWNPEKKLDEIANVTEEHSDLPNVTKPGWHLETILTKKLRTKISQVSRPFPHDDVANFPTTPLSVDF